MGDNIVVMLVVVFFLFFKQTLVEIHTELQEMI